LVFLGKKLGGAVQVKSSKQDKDTASQGKTRQDKKHAQQHRQLRVCFITDDRVTCAVV